MADIKTYTDQIQNAVYGEEENRCNHAGRSEICDQCGNVNEG